jgi:hypothetical protein
MNKEFKRMMELAGLTEIKVTTPGYDDLVFSSDITLNDETLFLVQTKKGWQMIKDVINNHEPIDDHNLSYDEVIQANLETLEELFQNSGKYESIVKEAKKAAQMLLKIKNNKMIKIFDDSSYSGHAPGYPYLEKLAAGVLYSSPEDIFDEEAFESDVLSKFGLAYDDLFKNNALIYVTSGID